MTKFYILNGVRRALASREWNRKTIPAIVFLGSGKKPVLRPRMSLVALFSPKPTIRLDERFTRILPPIFDPIEVELLGNRGQLPVLPLSKVRLA
jgi:hypothetical protein